MPFHKVDATKELNNFLKKNPDLKPLNKAENRYYELRKHLKEYKEFAKIPLEDISSECNLTVKELENIEKGIDKDIIHFLIYVKVLNLDLNLQI